MQAGARLGVLAVVLGSWGCGLVGPSCIDRQQRGTSREESASVAAGQTVALRLDYDTRGSQNDLEVRWWAPDAGPVPRVGFFVTRVGCEAGPHAAADPAGPCAVIAQAATPPGSTQGTLIVTHGRGNPEVLGTPPAFLLWVIGDPSARASYTVRQTWFAGPDC